LTICTGSHTQICVAVDQAYASSKLACMQLD